MKEFNETDDCHEGMVLNDMFISFIDNALEQDL